MCVCVRQRDSLAVCMCVCVYKLLGDTVKESLLGALMSLTLFPTNKRQSWARARDRELARRARAGRGDLELERRPRAGEETQSCRASQVATARHSPWHRNWHFYYDFNRCCYQSTSLPGFPIPFLFILFPFPGLLTLALMNFLEILHVFSTN